MVVRPSSHVQDCFLKNMRLNGAQKVTYIGNFTPYLHALDDTSAWCLSRPPVHRYPEPGKSLQYRCFMIIIGVHGNLNVHVIPSYENLAQEPAGPFYPHPVISATRTALR
jgi:hypothetical protein